MKAFFGTFVNKVDAKGRVSVPAPFRAVIQGRGLNSVALHPSLIEPCLEGAGFDRFENLESEIPDSFAPVKRNEIAELVMGELRELLLDSEGRIVLPDEFIAKANLKDQATFIGQGKFFQIWEPVAIAAAIEAKRQRVIAALKQNGGA